MKGKSFLAALVLAAGFSLMVYSQARATCTPTGFYVDNINMTAAMINPGNVTGTDIDASGCNIGIYYDDGTDGGPVGGTVSGATVSNANYFGIVANGGGGNAALVVNVSGSTVENISEMPPNGAQHGNAIFYINGSTDPSADDSRTCSGVGSTAGTIAGNTVSGYQKNGITAKCPGVLVSITGNTVTGAGETTAIAQNGIELGVGALGTISSNAVSDNEYTGANDASSSGILVFGGGPYGALAVKEHVTNNTLTDNDVGIFSLNCGNADCTGPPKNPTNNILMSNSLSNEEVSNVSGCGSPQGYQAGISDLGRNDQISRNSISGVGYATNQITCGASSTAAVFDIDNTGSNSKVHKNNSLNP